MTEGDSYVIQIAVADATTFVSRNGVLIVRNEPSSTSADDIAAVVESSDDVFLGLARLAVETGFDMPSFACILEGDPSPRVFIRGHLLVTAGDELLDGSGTSTWVEHTLSPNGPIEISNSPVGDTTPEGPSDVESSAGSQEPDPLLAGPGPSPDIVEEAAVESLAAENPIDRVEGTSGPERADADPPALVDPDAANVEKPVPSVSEPIGGLAAAAAMSHQPPGPASAPPRSPATPDPNLIGAPAPSNPQPEDGSEGVAEDLSATAATEPPTDLPATSTADPEATLDADAIRQRPADAIGDLPVVEVTARVCPCGQANPVSAMFCRACGQSLSRHGVSIDLVPRPSLGFIEFDDGERVELTRQLVIGRNAPSGHDVGGDTALPVTIASPSKHVSKAHVEVRLVDWDIEVVDLDSANGTYVESSDGRPPRRLRAHVAEQIAAGDTVTLGDRRFRVLPPED